MMAGVVGLHLLASIISGCKITKNCRTDKKTFSFGSPLSAAGYSTKEAHATVGS
jgi:hypothetical protein